MRPAQTPIGLHLAQAAREVGRAFDDALAAEGGSLPVWLVLLNLKARRPGNQRELADAIGVREATLTHHLNNLETRGLITRTRHQANRRIHVVELTEAGESAFLRMRDAAFAFDSQLRAGFTEQQSAQLGEFLDHLIANVGGHANEQAPWAGLAEGR